MSTVQRRIGKYELQQRLGQGGMAEVWKALDTRLQRYVAIKLLHADLQHDPDFMRRFEREARIIASLRHPNIVQIHDFQVSHPPESESTVAYMVMDYIEGPTLADYIKNTSAAGIFPSATEIVHLFASISTAVDYAHSHGMIHRDIKPANILLDSRQTTQNPMGEPILTDFGIAKLMVGTTGTLSGAWKGTPLCISPEQVQGYPGNERSDIYALGVILYEMCTGTLPFQGNSPSEIMLQHLNARPLPPSSINPHIPPALSLVILRSLDKNPAARFPSASSMTAALAEALHIPVPENISGPAYPTDLAYSTTPLSSTGSRPVDLTPSAPALLPGSATTPDVGARSIAPAPLGNTPALASQTPSMAASPDTPVLTPSIRNSGSSIASSPPTPVLTPALPSTPPFVSAPTPAPRRRWRWILLTLLVLLVLLGTGLGAFLLISHKSPIATNPIVGYAFFVSSGQIIDNNSQGLNDQLQINLQNIPAPAAGKSYYAWLLGDRLCDVNSNSYVPPQDWCAPTQTFIKQPLPSSILLGSLPPIHNGSVKYLYSGDAKYTNLITFMSRLVITEQNTAANPDPPSASATGTWRFYAELPQLDSSHGKHFSALHGLRGMLFGGSDLINHHIYGGLDRALLRNTQKVLEWTKSASDSWGPNTPDINIIHRQVVRILYYLDGMAFVSKDISPQEKTLVGPNDARFGFAPLMNFSTAGGPGSQSSYQQRITNHLCYIILAPDTPVSMRNAAITTYTSVNTLQRWFNSVRNDAKQLVNLTDDQLRQPSVKPILNDMLFWANVAFVGQVNPNTGTLQPGVVQIHYSIQNLAAFVVRPYVANQQANPLRLNVPLKTSSYTCTGS